VFRRLQHALPFLVSKLFPAIKNISDRNVFQLPLDELEKINQSLDEEIKILALKNEMETSTIGSNIHLGPSNSTNDFQEEMDHIIIFFFWIW